MKNKSSKLMPALFIIVFEVINAIIIYIYKYKEAFKKEHNIKPGDVTGNEYIEEYFSYFQKADNWAKIGSIVIIIALCYLILIDKRISIKKTGIGLTIFIASYFLINKMFEYIIGMDYSYYISFLIYWTVASIAGFIALTLIRVLQERQKK